MTPVLLDSPSVLNELIGLNGQTGLTEQLTEGLIEELTGELTEEPIGGLIVVLTEEIVGEE